MLDDEEGSLGGREAERRIYRIVHLEDVTARPLTPSIIHVSGFGRGDRM